MGRLKSAAESSTRAPSSLASASDGRGRKRMRSEDRPGRREKAPGKREREDPDPPAEKRPTITPKHRMRGKTSQRPVFLSFLLYQTVFFNGWQFQWILLVILLMKNNPLKCLYIHGIKLQVSSSFKLKQLDWKLRWPGGAKLGLEPEGDEPEEDEEEEEDERPKPKAKAKARASKAKPKAGSSIKKNAKFTPSDKGGRSVFTDYYNHPTLGDMPVWPSIIQNVKKHK